jgi:RecB family exonuclease
MSDLPVPLSASKLKTFDECPEQFRLRYIERMPEEGGENRYIRRGNAVHEAIEDVLPEYDTGWDQDFLKHRLNRAYRENGGRSGYELSDEDHEFTLDCIRVAARFIDKKQPNVVSVECRVPFATDRVDHGYGFDGYVDVVTETEVWDWKTGKSDGKNLDETLQGAVYMIGFLAHTGRLPEQIHFVYLKEEKVRSREPSDEMYDAMVEKARSLMQAVDTNIFPAKPGDPCYWCGYEVHCSESPVGGGGIDWETYP